MEKKSTSSRQFDLRRDIAFHCYLMCTEVIIITPRQRHQVRIKDLGDRGRASVEYTRRSSYQVTIYTAARRPQKSIYYRLSLFRVNNYKGYTRASLNFINYYTEQCNTQISSASCKISSSCIPSTFVDIMKVSAATAVLVALVATVQVKTNSIPRIHIIINRYR